MHTSEYQKFATLSMRTERKMSKRCYCPVQFFEWNQRSNKYRYTMLLNAQ